MTRESRLKAATPLVLALLLVAPAAVLAAPPPPPGGHLPLGFGGANQGGYPSVPAGVEAEAPGAPPALAQVSSAPNPFRAATVIRFTVGAGADARLRIVDLSGREVRRIVHRAAASGIQEVVWDGRSATGGLLPAGIYFYAVEAGARTVTKKLVLLR